MSAASSSDVSGSGSGGSGAMYGSACSTPKSLAPSVPRDPAGVHGLRRQKSGSEKEIIAFCADGNQAELREARIGIDHDSVFQPQRRGGAQAIGERSSRE